MNVTRDTSLKHVFGVVRGCGFHQPQDAPHWVQTGVERCVSYAFVYETDASRARGRIFSANHSLHKLGVPPKPPGTNHGADNLKSSVIKVVGARGASQASCRCAKKESDRRSLYMLHP